MILSTLSGKFSLNRLAAPSSGNATAEPSGISRSEVVVWSSAFTWNESKKKRSESAWISKVWIEGLLFLVGGRCERMSAT